MNRNRPSVLRVVRGPIMLIVLGTLFAIGQTTAYSFWRTWPALVIAFGLLKLLEHLADRPKETEQYVSPGGNP